MSGLFNYFSLNTFNAAIDSPPLDMAPLETAPALFIEALEIPDF